MALGSAVSFGFGLYEGISGIFGNPNDSARFSEANQLRDAAVKGDAFSYWKLRCLSGDNSALTREMVVKYGWQQPGFTTPCGYATDEARAYAKSKLLEVDARVKVADASGKLVLLGTGVGTGAAPGAFVDTITPAFVARIPTWVYLAAAGAVAFIILRRK
jgi:hypothetical protein